MKTIYEKGNCYVTEDKVDKCFILYRKGILFLRTEFAVIRYADEKSRKAARLKAYNKLMKY